MGFGLLFFGCFLTYFGALTPISAFTYVAGGAIMLYSLYKLSNQNKGFLISTVTSVVLLIDSLAVVIMYVFGVKNIAYDILIYAQTFLPSVLLVMIMISVIFITKEVGLKKIQGWSIVNIGFVGIYTVCNLLSFVIRASTVIQRLGIVCIVSQILYSAFTLIILFNCYAKICYEEDKDMKNNATGMPVFDFLNKLFNKVSNKNKKNGPYDKGDK